MTRLRSPYRLLKQRYPSRSTSEFDVKLRVVQDSEPANQLIKKSTALTNWSRNDPSGG